MRRRRRKLEESELNALCTLLLLPASQHRGGRECIARLVDRCGSFAACVAFLGSSGANSANMDKSQHLLKQQLREARRKHNLQHQARYCQTVIAQRGLVVLTFQDSAYPNYLKNIPDPPLALFVESNGAERALATCNRSPGRIAVVGSRRALLSSRDFAEDLCMRLAGLGFEIVSGLATGIDAAAHLGALRETDQTGRGTTIAVLGSGHLNIYPRKNEYLYRRILRNNGAVVSEFLPTVAPLKQNFPARNRIVSGLCVCVVVIEATGKSGSLITARLALEQGRDVLVVPGMVRDPRFAGCHRLIKQGAALIEGYEDVLLCLGIQAPEEQESMRLQTSGLSKLELDILHKVGFQVTGLDQLLSRATSTIPELMKTLLSLELHGYVRACSGGYVRLK